MAKKRATSSRPREQRKLWRQIKELLQEAHGDRLQGVLLYGSEARGEASADSDIDLLVLLKGPIELWRDIRTNVNALYDLEIQDYRSIHAIPVDMEDYRAGEYPLYRNVKKEGIVL